jgi:hypothetical protein
MVITLLSRSELPLKVAFFHGLLKDQPTPVSRDGAILRVIERTGHLDSYLQDIGKSQEIHLTRLLLICC